MRVLYATLALVAFCLSGKAFAVDPKDLPKIDPKRGAEFTLTSYDIAHAPLLFDAAEDDTSTEEGNKKLRELAEEVKKRCPDCALTWKKNRYNLDYFEVDVDKRFQIHYGLDPEVIEINMSPMTGKEMLANEQKIDDLIFGAGKAIGIEADVMWGGGHIHLDLNTLVGDDPLLFRNFVADTYNQSDVFKAFGSGPNNSPVILELVDPKQKEALAEVFAEFDDKLKKMGYFEPGKKISQAQRRKLIVGLAQEIEKKVYYTTPSGKAPAKKYHALNLSRIADENIPWEQKTAEFRVFRAQKSLREFVNVGDMLAGRVAHLKEALKGKVLALDLPKKLYTQTRGYVTTAKRLMRYISESGMNFSTMSPSIFAENIGNYLGYNYWDSCGAKFNKLFAPEKRAN